MNTHRTRPLRTSLILLASLLAVLAGTAGWPANPASAAEDDQRPNIVVIMVDDLGFADLGCFGSEIETPNLDALASSGLRFTQFYNCGKCETTRATLMSGRYHPEVKTRKLENCVTIAEAMKLAGYHTMMTGKWHLESDPIARGFDKYFGHLSGATNYFSGDNTFRLQQEVYKIPDQGFYTTDANTDFAIRFLNEWKRDEQTRRAPFFLYIAHNAPHYPLQCPQREYEKYRDRYAIGWDQLRRDRFERQKKIGLFPAHMKLPPRPANVPDWDSIDEKERADQRLMMAAFAGMVDRVDQNVGRLTKTLQSLGALDNTLILFLSDNGACPFQRSRPETRARQLMPYDAKSYWTYDRGWAHAGNTPFREYKQNQHEGGIASPTIAHWPNGISPKGRITRQTGHLVDIMATCLDLAEAKYPQRYQGQPIGPARGLSLRPIFAGQQRPAHEYLFFSFRGKNNAIRVGDWKLVNKNGQPFELYNLAEDRNELNDLAKENPQKLQAMESRLQNVFAEVGAKASPPKRKSKK